MSNSITDSITRKEWLGFVIASFIECIVVFIWSQSIPAYSWLSLHMNVFLLGLPLVVAILCWAAVFFYHYSLRLALISVILTIGVSIGLSQWQPWCVDEGALIAVDLKDGKGQTFEDDVSIYSLNYIEIQAFSSHSREQNEQFTCLWSLEGKGGFTAANICNTLYKPSSDTTSDLINVRLQRNGCSRVFYKLLYIRMAR